MQIWFGIGENSKILLRFILAIFGTGGDVGAGGGESVQWQVRHSCRPVAGCQPRRCCGFIILPGALPEILTGLRIGLRVGWSTLVAAELIAVTRGLGFMVQSAGVLATDVVLAGTSR